MSSKDSQPKNKDIRSLATDLVYKASWTGAISPEEAVIKILKIAEQAANKALTDFDKNLVGHLPFPLCEKTKKLLKRSLVLDAVGFALRDTKTMIKEKYHIVKQVEL